MKLIKRIVSLFIIISLIVTSSAADYAMTTEYNESVAVDESIQLKIPGGATKIDWSTTSKRIAQVTKNGLVTGVKKGSCDIICRAEYSKFVFFKDVVNYTFHINVIGKRNSISNNVVYNDTDYAYIYYELFINDDVTNADEFQPEILKKGEIVKEKAIPKSSIANFKEWCLDLEGNDVFQFGQKIESDIVLFAKWDVDEKDTDGDGLIDVLEGNKYKTSIYETDTDGDELSDFVEVQNGLNPLLQDSNNNGISDFDDDLDSDGLKNGDEIRYSTEMRIADSDGDGLFDGEEVNVYKTDPNNEDTDGDGATDGWEVENGFDPVIYNAVFEVKGYSNEVSEANPVGLEVIINSNGKNAESLCIKPQQMSDTYLASATVPGYMGYMYDISTEEAIDNATLTFSYDVQKFGNVDVDFQPRVYYVNETNGTYEELPNQKVENGKVVVTVSHFSKYILLNSVEFNKVWETDIKAPNAKINSMEGIDMVLVIDTSGSMQNNDPKNIRIDVCNRIIDKLTNNDKASIVDFDEGSKTLCALTSNKSTLKSAVKSINSDGGTNLSKGLAEGIKKIINSSNNRYKTMFFLTDGKDNNGKGVNNTSRTQIEDLVNEAISNNIIINTIGLGNDIEAALLKYDIAEKTGGKYYFAEDAEALNTVVDDYIIDNIDYTTDSNNDGIVDYYTEMLKTGKLFMPGYPLGFDFNKYGEDYDDDGLKNGEEIEILIDKNDKPYVVIHSNPFVPDTDYDSFSDFEEKQRGSYAKRYDKRKSELDYFLNVDERTYKAVSSYDNNSPLYIFKRFMVDASTVRDVYTSLLTKYFTEYCLDSYIYNGDTVQNKSFDDICDQILGITNKKYRSAMLNSDTQALDAISKVNDEIAQVMSIKTIAEFVSGVTDYTEEKIDLFKNMISDLNGISPKLKIAFKLDDYLDTAGKVSNNIGIVINLGTQFLGTVERLTILSSNNSLIRNNINLLKSLSSYGKRNKDSSMALAADSIIDAALGDITGIINNQMINAARFAGKKLGLEALAKVTGVPIEEIVDIMVTIIDVKNKYDMTKNAFNRLSTSDKYDAYSEFQGLIIMHKTAREIIMSLSEVENDHYVFGVDIGQSNRDLVSNANTFGMSTCFLAQTRILIKNNICSVQYNNFGNGFNIEQAKMLIGKLRLPINDSFYNSNIPIHYFVQGR